MEVEIYWSSSPRCLFADTGKRMQQMVSRASVPRKMTSATQLTEAEKIELELESRWERIEASFCKIQREQEAKLDEIQRLIQGLRSAMETMDASSGSCKSQLELPKFAGNVNFQKSTDFDRAIADDDLVQQPSSGIFKVEQHCSGRHGEMDTKLKIGVGKSARVKEIEDADFSKVELFMPLPHNWNSEKVNDIDSESYKLSFSHNSMDYPAGNSVRASELPKFANEGFDGQTLWNRTTTTMNGIDYGTKSWGYPLVKNSAWELEQDKLKETQRLSHARQNEPVRELIVDLPILACYSLSLSWLLNWFLRPMVKLKFLASLANRVFDGGGMDEFIHMDATHEDPLLAPISSSECSLYDIISRSTMEAGRSISVELEVASITGSLNVVNLVSGCDDEDDLDCVDFYSSHNCNSVSLGLLWRCASKLEAGSSLVASVFSKDYISEIFDIGSSRLGMDHIGGLVEQRSNVVEEESTMSVKNALAFSGKEFDNSRRFSLQFDVDAKAKGPAKKEETYGAISGARWAEQMLLNSAFSNSTYRSVTWLLVRFPKPMVKMKFMAQHEEEIGDKGNVQWTSSKAREDWIHEVISEELEDAASEHVMGNSHPLMFTQLIDKTWKAKREELVKKFEGLCMVIRNVLGSKVEKVIVSDRVVDSSCCSVTGKCGWTVKKTVEISSGNPIKEELRKRADYMAKLRDLGNNCRKFVGLMTEEKGDSGEVSMRVINEHHGINGKYIHKGEKPATSMLTELVMVPLAGKMKARKLSDIGWLASIWFPKPTVKMKHEKLGSVIPCGQGILWGMDCYDHNRREEEEERHVGSELDRAPCQQIMWIVGQLTF